MYLSVTFLLTAAFAVMLVVLSVHTSLRRRALQVAHGDAGDEQLKRRIRAHGNFIENAPLLLIMVAALEIGLSPLWIVTAVAAVFLVARVLHVFGTLYAKGPTLRATAMVLQHTVMILAAGMLIYLAIGR